MITGMYIPPHEDFAHAIILQAVEDYRTALHKLHRNPKNKTALHRQKEIESFFFSEWFNTLTNVDPTYLVCRLRAEKGERPR